jgi:hypothetical protein
MTTQQLEDQAQIDRVLKLYFRGADRTDWELIRSCFFQDAQVDMTSDFFQGDRDRFIDDYLRSPAALGGFTRTMHIAGNTIIELDGDIAYTETYVTAHHTTTDDHEWAGKFVTVWLRYIDRFERRRREWRIAKRNIVIEWVRMEPADRWSDVPAPGRRDKGDLVYAR